MHEISSLFNACKIAKRAIQSASNDLYALIHQDLETFASNSFVIEAKTFTPKDFRKHFIFILQIEKFSLSNMGGDMVEK